MQAKVSVVVTAYNIEKYILQCLESVRNQSYKNIEVILVDDGSTDNTREVVEGYRSKYTFFEYHRQENAGVSVARNYGIEHSSGDYIAFVDGDDFLDPDFIEVLLNHMSESTDIICSCCTTYGDDSYIDHFFNKSYVMCGKEEKRRLFYQLMNGNFGKPNGKGSTAIGVPWGKLYRLDLLKRENMRFDPRLRRMQDNMFNMYAFYQAEEIIYIDEAHYNYRLEHITSKSTIYKPEIWEALIVARNEFFEEHDDVIDATLNKYRLYELNVAFAASLIYVAKKENNFSSAKRKMKEIKKLPAYKLLFSNNKNEGIPLKLRGIRFLAMVSVYLPIYVVLRRV